LVATACKKNFFLAEKKFLCGGCVQRQELQRPGGTPFAAAGRGGCSTYPITTSNIVQKKFGRKKILYTFVRILLCS